MEYEEIVNRTAILLRDLFDNRVSLETIELAKTLTFTDSTFVLMLAGANTELNDFKELTELVREEIERL